VARKSGAGEAIDIASSPPAAGFFRGRGIEMNKEQKQQAVQEIAAGLEEAEAIFAVDYRGITVTQAAELRTRLAEAQASFKVVKNRLAKRAAEQAGTPGLDELLEGPTALTLIAGDPVVAAKAISGFSRQHDVLAFKGGLMDGAALTPEQFTAIARLPGLDVLRGQLVGMTASPLTGLLGGLNGLIAGIAMQLGQIAEKGLVSGEAPAAKSAPAEAEEAPAEEETPTAEAEEAPTAGESPASEEPPAEAGEDESTSDEPEED
jgi:large subunit ribosomal protein L10